MTDNSGFNYTVKKGDGLTQVFLQKAKADKLSGDEKSINWSNVLSVFDEINSERKGTSDTPLYHGGSDKTNTDWHKDYVVYEDQKISLSDDELGKVYDAMGFKKSAEPATVPDAKPTVTVVPESPVTEPAVAIATTQAAETPKPAAYPERTVVQNPDGTTTITIVEGGNVAMKLDSVSGFPNEGVDVATGKKYTNVPNEDGLIVHPQEMKPAEGDSVRVNPDGSRVITQIIPGDKIEIEENAQHPSTGVNISTGEKVGNLPSVDGVNAHLQPLDRFELAPDESVRQNPDGTTTTTQIISGDVVRNLDIVPEDPTKVRDPKTGQVYNGVTPFDGTKAHLLEE